MNDKDITDAAIQEIAAILAAGYLRYRRAQISGQSTLIVRPRRALMVTRLTALKTSEKEMTIRAEIEALRSMTVGRLRDRYAEVFGEPSRSYNRQFLFRRVAWRIQALAEGGLSERARQAARLWPRFSNWTASS